MATMFICLNMSTIFNQHDNKKPVKWEQIERQKAYEREAKNMKARGESIPMSTIIKLSPLSYKTAIKYNHSLLQSHKK